MNDKLLNMKVKEIFTEFKKVKLDPNDVLLFKTDVWLTDEQYADTKDNLSKILPNNKIIILHGGSSLEIIKKVKVNKNDKGIAIRTFIGFYDKNGKELKVGQIVKTHDKKGKKWVGEIATLVINTGDKIVYVFRSNYDTFINDQKYASELEIIKEKKNA